MKNTAIALLFALGSSLALSAAANEYQFNDRSVIVDVAQPNSDNPPSVDVSGYSFNDRSREFIVAEPAGADQSHRESMMTQSYVVEPVGNS